MKRFRDAATIWIFVALVGVSAAAAVQVYRQGLPQPAVLDPFEPVMRIASPEFEATSRAAKLRLVRHLEKEFIRGIDWRVPLAELDDRQWARFQANFDELMRIWFVDKVDTYFALRERERKRYLEQEIGNLKSWPVLARRGDPQQRIDLKLSGIERLSEIARQMHTVYLDASPKEQYRMQQFVMAAARHGFERLSPNPE